MLHESIWVDRPKYEQAEAHYQRFLAGTIAQPAHGAKSAKVRFVFFISVHVHNELIKRGKYFSQSNRRLTWLRSIKYDLA